MHARAQFRPHDQQILSLTCLTLFSFLKVFFFCSLGHCFLFLCFSSPARVAFGRKSKKKKNRPLELSSEVRSRPNMIVHANKNIVFEQLHHLPDPMKKSGTDRFKSFSESWGECTTETNRPSLQQQRQKERLSTTADTETQKVRR